MSHNVKGVVPFLRVSNMERSLRYYLDGLGFTLTNKWVVAGKVRWCWLTLGGAAVMLQEFGAEEPVGGDGISLWFQCEDAIAIYREFRSRAIEASEPKVGNGLWDFGVTDPDGYQIRFESPSDKPEDTILSEVASTETS